MLGFRQSKFKHVYGQGTKKELCYDNVRVTKNAWDSNLIKVNPFYLSLNWDAAAGGAFAVIPLDERGKLPDLIPLFKGHSAPVLDTDFNPFNDSLLASASEDGKICLWSVPQDFTVLDKEAPDVSPVSRLTGHSRKVGNVTFHPNADNVLASSSSDYTVKFWDIVKGTNQLTLKHADIIQSISFNRDGNTLVTTCRDKKIRIWDPRTNKVAQEAPGHAGAKNSRAVFLNNGRIATTGFGKIADRQLGLWDVNNLGQPLGGFTMLDQSAGVIMPFYDNDTKILYLAGKGDGNIRYYEFDNDEFWPLSEYKSPEPQRGLAFMPKRGLSVHENEVMRAYKSVRDVLVEPITFIVPRRSEMFQEDIYPDTLSGEPSLSADEWFAGSDIGPKLVSMESIYKSGNAQMIRQRQFVPQTSPEPETRSVPSETSAKPIVGAPVELSSAMFPSPSKAAAFVEVKGPLSPEKQEKKDETPPKQVHIPDSATVMPPSLKQPQGKTPSSAGSNAGSTNESVDRLLAVVEKQSETIDAQGRKIKGLEDQIAKYLTVLNVLEKKVDNLTHGQSESKVLEDDDGSYVEI